MIKSLPRAILFDLDDTILAFSEGAAACWQTICQRFGPQLEGLSPEELFAAIMESRAWFWTDPRRHRSGRLHLEHTRREIVSEAFARLQMDAPALAREIADAYSLEREGTIRPFPGAMDTLRQLRDKSVRLALITSGSAQVQRRKIDRFGLASLFDCILIEEEFGVGKPHERIYLYALEQLDTEPGETWMVGDNLLWDVQAPQRLGIWGIWLDLAGCGLPATSRVRPDRIIRSLAELVQVNLCPT